MEENKITTRKVFGFLGKVTVVVATGAVIIGASPFARNINNQITAQAGAALKALEKWENEKS